MCIVYYTVVVIHAQVQRTMRKKRKWFPSIVSLHTPVLNAPSLYSTVIAYVS